MGSLEFNIFLSVTFLQVGVISVTCAFLVSVFKSLCACDRLLFQAQTRLVCMKQNSATFFHSLLTCKLKLMTHYELVHSGKPFTFHLGPLGGISSNTCSQVRLQTFAL